MLKIANSYGNFDLVHETLPRGYEFVAGKRLQPLCNKHHIKFVPGVVDFTKTYRKYPAKPVIGGVVVTAHSAPKLRQLLAERGRRANSPSAVRAKERKQRRKQQAEQQHQEQCQELGVLLRSRTAEWLKRGEIDSDLAELIAFKTHYRHNYTDYDERFDEEQFECLRLCGYSPQDAAESVKDDARNSYQEEPIPGNWLAYLDKYGFEDIVSLALANTLADPTKCHPRWFKEAAIAVRRAGLPLATLTYRQIRGAIDSWRYQRCFDND